MLLYDQQFVTDHFRAKEKDNKKIKGVFLVDKANAIKEDELREKNDALKTAQENLNKAEDDNKANEEAKKNLYPGLTEECDSDTDAFRARFKTKAKGVLRNRQTKPSLVKDILSYYENGDILECPDIDALLETSEKACEEGARGDYRPLTVPDNMRGFESLEGWSLLKKHIKSSAGGEFADLISKIHATEWVKTGFDHYMHDPENKNAVCPFCQKTKISDFEDELAASFDEEYQKDMVGLRALRENYKNEMGRVYKVFESNTLCDFPAFEAEKYKKLLSALAAQIQLNLNTIDDKIRDPESEYSVGDIDSQLDELSDYITAINFKIRDNNDLVNRQDTVKETCIKDVGKHLAFMMKQKIDDYKAEEARLNGETTRLNGEIKKYTDEIAQINKDIIAIKSQGVNTQTAMTKINTMLHESCFQGFSVEPVDGEDDVYMVKRPGETGPAEGLSEGEMNFLAFLYFYQMVQGNLDKDKDTKRKIIVIDDPVTSMDSSALFIVGSLVREMIKVCTNSGTLLTSGFEGTYIDQIFVLTHNVLFHREVTMGQDSDDLYKVVSFYQINKSRSVSHIIPCYAAEEDENGHKPNRNPVRGTYVTLWAEYRNATTATDVLHHIRLILEHYFIQLSGFDGPDLYETLLNDDKNKKNFYEFDENGNITDDTEFLLVSTMLRYFVASPSVIDDGQYYIQDTDDPDIYRRTFKKIFEVLDQPRHYEHMLHSTDSLVKDKSVGRV